MKTIEYEVDKETDFQQKEIYIKTKHLKTIRIYIDGIFDLFHYGHARAFKQLKTSFPNCTVVVGVSDDKTTHQRKGLTVMSELERYESVRGCRWVDEVVESAPWIVTENFIHYHKLDYIAHDPEPYPGEGIPDVYSFIKETGRFLPTKRTKVISTTRLIERILRNNDAFVIRNLLRGKTRKDMNLSFLQEKRLFLQIQIENFKKTLKKNLFKGNKKIKTKFNSFSEDVKYKLISLFSF